MSKFTKYTVVAFAFAFLFVGSAKAALAIISVPPNLIQGSSGQEVMDLQASLGGLTIDGAFGPLTRSTVVTYQSSHGLVADGIVGAMTAASINASSPVVGGTYPAGCTSSMGYSVTTGMSCAGGMTYPTGCTSTVGFSPTTGMSCAGTPTPTPSDDGVLDGGAGSVDTYTLLSEFSNEDVGEGEEDVTILGLEAELDNGSDLEFTSMKVWFENSDGSTSSSEDFDDYATEVSIWMDGEEVGREDVSDFSADDDDGDGEDEWTSTISLDGAICDADETCEFNVAVSAQNSIDSADSDSDSWATDVTNVRFMDAEGTTISEDPTIVATTEMNFGTFADATDLELKVSLSDDSPESQTLDVDSSDNTDGVELLAFEIEAEGSEMVIHDIPVLVTVAQPSVTDDVDFIINTLTLTVDGETYSETVSTSAGSTATITFDNLDITIGEDDMMEFVVTADFNDTEASEFVEGDTIKVELTTLAVDDIDADDAEGDSIVDVDATGTALGDEMSLYNAGIMVSFVSATEVTAVDDGADDDTGTFTVEFTVEAFGGTVYISDTAAATVSTSIAETSLTGADGILYLVEDSGTATVDDLADILTETGDADASANSNWTLTEGESATFTLTVTQTNDSVEDDGLYRMLLKSIGWNTTDSATVYNVYDFDLEDFKTDPLSLN